jgi:hypothetical protein
MNHWQLETGNRKLAIMLSTGDWQPATLFDNCREICTNQTFYAKRTQFSKKSNERKYYNNKGI